MTKKQKAGKRVLFVPSLKKSDGLYRMRRSFRLAVELGDEASVFLGDERQQDIFSRDEIYTVFGFPKKKALKDLQSGPRWDFIVFDRGCTSLEEFKIFSPHADLLIGIDEEGPAREYLSYLIDTLPGMRGEPNVSSIAFLDTPPHQHEITPELKKFLLIFPGAAYHETAPIVADILLKDGLAVSDTVAVASFPGGNQVRFPERVLLLNPAEIREQYFKYDMVITSCSYSAVEAIHAGVPAVCIASTPEEYDRFRRIGLPQLSATELKRDQLLKYIKRPERLIDQVGSLIAHTRRSLSLFLTELDARSGNLCPCCGKGDNRVVHRETTRSFFRCRSCGAVYSQCFSRYGIPLRRATGGEQQGVSLEVLKASRKLFLQRLKLIKVLLGPQKRERGLLEVGCSYGAFSSVALDEGFKPFCIDYDSSAAAYVQEILKIPSCTVRFEDLDRKKGNLPEPFDVVTIWDAFDHFESLDPVLRTINNLLRKGGVFALSASNIAGSGAKKNLSGFLESLPFHHRFVVSPQILQGILKRYGFTVRAVRSRGGLRIAEQGKNRKPSVWERLLNVLRPGDVFELYAVKDRSLS